MICFQELGDHGPKLLGERLDGRRLRGQPGYVIARGDPDPGFGIPIGMDLVDEAAHQAGGYHGLRSGLRVAKTLPEAMPG